MALSSDNIANFHSGNAMSDTAPKPLQTSMGSGGISSSSSSGGGGGGGGGHGGHDSAPSSPVSSTSSRRRSSGALFTNLQSLKSPTSDADQVRRASMTDQHRSSGLFSTFFNSITGRNPK